MPSISGQTQLFFMLADPISQVRTPATLNRWFHTKGIDGILVPSKVSSTDLGVFMSSCRTIQNLGGIVISVPHKQAIMPYCDVLDDSAKQGGAVNVIHKQPDGTLVGGLFDGLGFTQGMIKAGHDPAHKKILLLGAGGAAYAIASALLGHHIAALGIQNRSLDKAQQLQQHLLSYYPDQTIDINPTHIEDYDWVVNATSLGMKPDDALPMDVNRLTPTQVVAEIIMTPAETTLLTQAQQRGCTIHHGAHMLTEQINQIGHFILYGLKAA